jgi:hypothetical protein
MNVELRRIWKEAIVACFQVLSQLFPGGTEEAPDDVKSGKPVSWARFGPEYKREGLQSEPTYPVKSKVVPVLN